ncbi:hypothetical protein Vi05172_g13181 [Venturia inaequalis]|nr:hypothetical protein Vi05172_g13181 [Venturia inaequalis]
MIQGRKLVFGKVVNAMLFKFRSNKQRFSRTQPIAVSTAGGFGNTLSSTPKFDGGRLYQSVAALLHSLTYSSLSDVRKYHFDKPLCSPSKPLRALENAFGVPTGHRSLSPNTFGPISNLPI